MSKTHNYTNYSKPGFTPVDSKEIPENAAPEQIEVTQVETVEPELEATPPPPLDGVVTAGKLNIRKLPAPNAEVIAQVAQGTILMIIPASSTIDWYKVYTPTGAEGYCMKKFVTVK